MRNVQVLILKDKEFLWANFTLGTVWDYWNHFGNFRWL